MIENSSSPSTFRLYSAGQKSSACSGFTLIELIAVIVILGIISAVGTQFLVTVVDSYRVSESRAKLIGKGRASLEQMTRYVRQAVPNSVRVSAGGECVEFLPTVGGANYLGELPDSENGAALSALISTSPIITGLGTVQHAVVSPLLATEIYTNASISARQEVSSVGVDSITLTSPHQFIRNSMNKRVFLADNPVRFCVTGGSLVLYESYGLLTTALGTLNPGGDNVLLALDVSASGTAFTLSNGIVNRNSVLNVSLNFTDRDNTVELTQRVFIRNVP